MRNQANLPKVAVIGSGFSGLCAAIQLQKQLGIKAQVFEMSADIGGTWYHNSYPGCACDIPSPLYSFSFELNPDWTYHYSNAQEIHQYMRNVAKKYHIYEQTRLNTEVISITWLEDQKLWKVDYRSVNTATEVIASEYYNYVFAGLGPLRVPNIPPQFEDYTGTIVHTANWDPSVNFKNKNVAVVGSGASAIQVIPELIKEVNHLTSYQRTPAWTFLRDQFKYSSFAKFLLRHVPFLMRMFRNAIFLQHELYYSYFGYNGSWISNLIHRLFKKLTAHRLNKKGRPDLIPILTPNFPPGCKRIAKSETYLEALAASNVTVVPKAIEKTVGNTIIDADGNKQQVDILVLATGFDTEGFVGNLQIYGRQGVSLRTLWKEHYPDTYKHATIHGFPNFFLLLGANVGLGHNSVVINIECQVDYAIRCIKHAINKNLIALEPKLSAQKTYTANIKKQFGGTVWKSGCNSWYLNKDGEVYGLWPGTVTSFWWNTLFPRFKNFIEYKK